MDDRSIGQVWSESIWPPVEKFFTDGWALYRGQEVVAQVAIAAAVVLGILLLYNLWRRRREGQAWQTKFDEFVEKTNKAVKDGVAEVRNAGNQKRQGR